MPRIPEKILCAAIWIDDDKPHPNQPTATGIVYCGYRHGNIFPQIPSEQLSDARLFGKIHQGFLTSNGRYLDREAALAIAQKQGQFISNYVRANRLFSEDLY